VAYLDIKLPTSAKVCVNTHVACSPRQTFMLAERYMLLCRRVDVFFSKTKVNNIYDMLLPVGVSPDEKVLWLDVAIDEMFRMDIFYP